MSEIETSCEAAGWNISYKLWIAAVFGSFLSGLGVNFLFTEDSSMTLWRAVMFVALAPFFEEIIFRRSIYRLALWKLSELKAELITAVLFSLWHFPSVAAMIYAFIMSFIFCLFYSRVGKLDASYLLHACANLGAMVYCFAFSGFSALVRYLFGAVCLICAGVSLSYVAARLQRYGNRFKADKCE